MPLVELAAVAESLPTAWKSRILASVGAANIKVLRMDEHPGEEEIHDYNEGLLVVEGRMMLEVDGESLTVESGGLYIAPAGVPHTVLPGSRGTLVIIDL
ncbi:MAG: cupin domain-containing protein [Janthinobacterium lividum]